MVAAKLANLENGGDRRTQDFKSQIREVISQPQAAELLNVSPRSVSAAKKVLKEAAPEVIAAVESGVMPVSAATQHIAALERYPYQARRRETLRKNPPCEPPLNSN